MLHSPRYWLTTILVLSLALPLQAQLNQLKKAAQKAVKQTVKPLELDFEVTKVKYDPLKSPDKVHINMVFRGHNANDLGIKLSRTEFDIYVDDKFVAKVYNDKQIEIPKNDDFGFEEQTSIEVSTAGKTLFKALRDDTVVYRIDGTYFVSSPIGEFNFKVELVEKEL
jgi:hypothetical protein